MNYNQIRRKTVPVKVGETVIGGDAPIRIQSMTNTDTHDAEATAAQIRQLADAGCELVRITVPDLQAAETVRHIKQSGIRVPIVADIHFDYRIALKCAEYGVDKIRINPGNIGGDDRVAVVCDACRERGIPIRIGVNGGSLEKHILAKYGAPVPEALAESALYHLSLLEKNHFYQTVVSIKASDVRTMIEANRLVAQKCGYPLHLGVTEAGGETMGTLKSAVGIGALLADGIGDTIRVSLTADPVKEVQAARQILKALEIEGQCGLNIVSCPTCGRTKIDLITLAGQFEDAANAAGLSDVPVTVALMGCVVNGPGEAAEADFGIAGGIGEALYFEHGQPIRKIPEEQIIPTLIDKLTQVSLASNGRQNTTGALKT